MYRVFKYNTFIRADPVGKIAKLNLKLIPKKKNKKFKTKEGSTFGYWLLHMFDAAKNSYMTILVYSCPLAISLTIIASFRTFVSDKSSSSLKIFVICSHQKTW